MVKIIREGHEIKVSKSSFKNTFEPLGYTLVEEKKVKVEIPKKVEEPKKGEELKKSEEPKKVEEPKKSNEKQED